MISGLGNKKNGESNGKKIEHALAARLDRGLE